MILMGKREYAGRQEDARPWRGRLDDAELESARNWAGILLYIALMTVPFLIVAWLLS